MTRKAPHLPATTFSESIDDAKELATAAPSALKAFIKLTLGAGFVCFVLFSIGYTVYSLSK